MNRPMPSATRHLSPPLSRRTFLAAAASAITALAMQPAPTTSPSTSPADSTVYLFTYFLGNGEDGLHLAFSRDGLNFQVLGGGKSYLTPIVGESKLMRDPCALLGPDGVFHMVWTCSWTGENIGYASSKDFIHWSPQKAIPIFGTPPPNGLRNCWAPEVVYEGRTQEYVIYWSSTITGRFPETAKSAESDYNHRMYYVTTKDFQIFSDPKLLVDPGFNTIDGTFCRAGKDLYLIVKDESKFPKVEKNLHVAHADSYTGPFSKMSPAFTPSWVEGPTAIDVGDRYIVYFDCYAAHHYGAMVTTDFKTWKDVTHDLHMPKGARHGTVLKVSEAVLKVLL